VKVTLSLVHLAALQLDRHVIDPEETHSIVDVLEHVLVTFGFSHDGVRAHRHES